MWQVVNNSGFIGLSYYEDNELVIGLRMDEERNWNSYVFKGRDVWTRYYKDLDQAIMDCIVFANDWGITLGQNVFNWSDVKRCLLEKS